MTSSRSGASGRPRRLRCPGASAPPRRLSAGAGAEFAGAEAGLFSQAAAGAGTMGVVGAADEAATQIGEMRIGERERFDVARPGKRAARDVVTGSVGGVVGGKFSQVLKGRLGGWVSGLSDDALAASGVTPEQLLSHGERLFAEWVAGSVASSPFTPTAGHMMDLALDGRLKVHTFGEFAGSVLDDMIKSAELRGFLTYAGARDAEPERPRQAREAQGPRRRRGGRAGGPPGARARRREGPGRAAGGARDRRADRPDRTDRPGVRRAGQALLRRDGQPAVGGGADGPPVGAGRPNSSIPASGLRVDRRPLVDLSSAGDDHGSHTHAFQLQDHLDFPRWDPNAGP